MNPTPQAPKLLRAARAMFLPDVLLALLVFVLVNVVSSRHFFRLHSRVTPACLSEKSLALLRSVSSPVRASLLMLPSNDAFDPSLAVLREFEANCPAFSLDVIDPDRQIAAAEALAARVPSALSESIVFEAAGRSAVVPADSLFAFGLPDDDPSTPEPRPVFLGERLFAGAVHSLFFPSKPAVFFLQGHGERSPDDFDRQNGFSRIAALLRNENLDVRPLDLASEKAVPPQCNLLVVAAPKHPLLPLEINLIRDFINRKGPVLFLLDARVSSGLEPLLADWGVQIGADFVFDPSHTLSGRDFLALSYPEHPVTRPLQGLATLFSLPRSVRPSSSSSSGDRPAFSPLVLSSADGWAEFDPSAASPDFDPKVDLPGPVPIAAAVERGPLAGVHVQFQPVRLVVFGDSSFVSNGGLAGANADLFLNAVNWLLERPDAIAPGPAPLPDDRVLMPLPVRRLFSAVIAIGFPALAALAGLVAAFLRRR